jgi:hypothetical protein
MIAEFTQHSFNGGEVSARLYGRTDSAIYDIAVAEMTNFAPTVEGPVIKRSGTQFIALADPAAERLVPFEFNSAQAYIIEFGPAMARFFSNDALILDEFGAPVTLALPYAAGQCFDITYRQSADVLYLTHPSWPAAAISRTGAAAFNYAALTLSKGPFADANTNKTITVSASASSGAAITLTASSAIFLPGHVGGLFQLQALDFSDVKVWEPGMTASAGSLIGSYCRSEGKIYLATAAADGASPKTGTSPPIHIEGSQWDGLGGKDVNAKGPFGVLWQYVCDNFGQMMITATGNPLAASTTATASVQRTLPSSLITVASWRWAFGRFSAQSGWPKHVDIWNSRLIFATDFEIFGSVVGDYRNFAAFDDTGRLQADSAFRFRLSTPNPINWLVSDLDLFIGTDRAEFSLGAINSAQAPGASNLRAVKQGSYGSVNIRPIQIKSHTIYVQRGRKKIRDAAYDYRQGRYTASDLLLWARHLRQPGMIELAWQDEPEELLWALTKNNVPLVHCQSPEQEVKGWATQPIADFNGATAKVLSIAAKPGQGGAVDEIWMLVQRGAIKTIERLNDWWVDGTAKAEAKYLDCASTYRGAPATHISGLPAFFAGQVVTALADGIVRANLTATVDGGGAAIDLPVAAAIVHVGIFYTARIVTLPLKAPTKSGGQSELKRKRIVKMMFRVIDTLGLYGGTWKSRLDEIIRRPQSANMNHGTDLFTGATSNVSVGAGSDREGQGQYESRLPLPAIVTFVNGELNVGDL